MVERESQFITQVISIVDTEKVLKVFFQMKMLRTCLMFLLADIDASGLVQKEGLQDRPGAESYLRDPRGPLSGILSMLHISCDVAWFILNYICPTNHALDR